MIDCSIEAQDIKNCFCKKTKKDNITTNINLATSFNAPIKEGQVLGTITYSLGEETLRFNKFSRCKLCS